MKTKDQKMAYAQKISKEAETRIGDQIVKAIQNNLKYEKPWLSGLVGEAYNPITDREYTGSNCLVLAVASQDHGFGSNRYATLKQWGSVGGSLKDGVDRDKDQTFALRPTTKNYKTTDRITGEDRFYKRTFFNYYMVFNIDQIDGIDQKYQEPKTEKPENADPVMVAENAETLIRKFPIRIDHGGSRACYIPSMDYIEMPNRETFRSTEFYYSVIFHELIHATGHVDRLDRFKGGKTEYSREELIAETGSTILLDRLGMAKQEVLDNHGAYIKGWMKNIKDDPAVLFKALTAGTKAATLILNHGIKNERIKK